MNFGSLPLFLMNTTEILSTSELKVGDKLQLRGKNIPYHFIGIVKQRNSKLFLESKSSPTDGYDLSEDKIFKYCHVYRTRDQKI